MSLFYFLGVLLVPFPFSFPVCSWKICSHSRWSISTWTDSWDAKSGWTDSCRGVYSRSLIILPPPGIIVQNFLPRKWTCFWLLSQTSYFCRYITYFTLFKVFLHHFPWFLSLIYNHFVLLATFFTQGLGCFFPQSRNQNIRLFLQFDAARAMFKEVICSGGWVAPEGGAAPP